MTIINAVGSLPGLGRLIVNTVLSAGNVTDRSKLYSQILPEAIRLSDNPTSNLDATLIAIRDSGLLAQTGEALEATPRVVDFCQGKLLTKDQFRRLLQISIFETNNEDPWEQTNDERLTSGAKDLNRALSWFLAQDVRSSLTWNKSGGGLDSAELLQNQQLPTAVTVRPFANDVRWTTFTRWSVALGLAEPVLTGNGLHPNPTVAIRDVTLEMTPGLRNVESYLGVITRQLPVIGGGSIRNSFLKVAGKDPDPDSAVGLIDTSIAQALLSLEEENLVVMPPPTSDANGKSIGLGSTERQITHIQIFEESVS